MGKYDFKNIKNSNKVKYHGYLDSSKLYNLIKICGENLEIHANLKTVISQYINRDMESYEYENLDLLYKYENKAPILAELFNGYYDLERRVFWVNNKDFVKIIIDKDVEDGYTLLIEENKVVGYCVQGSEVDMLGGM